MLGSEPAKPRLRGDCHSGFQPRAIADDNRTIGRLYSPPHRGALAFRGTRRGSPRATPRAITLWRRKDVV